MFVNSDNYKIIWYLKIKYMLVLINVSRIYILNYDLEEFTYKLNS